MARPRSGGSSQGPSERDRTNVLLEEMRSEIKRLSDGQMQLNQTMERRFEELRSEMNQRFDVVEQAVREISGRVKTHEQQAHAS